MRTLSSPVRGLKLAAISTALVASSVGLAPAALAVTPAPAALPHVAQYSSGGCIAGLNVTVRPQGIPVILTVRCTGSAATGSVTINSTPRRLPVVAADANGVSSYTIDTSTLELGRHTANLVYSDGTTQSLRFRVIAPQGSGGLEASGGGDGGLAFTGANAVVPLATIGAVLVLGGAGTYLVGRRRRKEST